MARLVGWLVCMLAFSSWCCAQNVLQQIQVSSLEHAGVALNLLFKNPLNQTPKIASDQTITLQHMTPFAPKTQRFDQGPLRSLDIYAKDGALFIVPKSASLFSVRAKLSADRTYLRLEFLPLTLTPLNTTPQPNSTPLPSKRDDGMLWDYAWKICLVLGFLLLVLWWLKRKNTQQFLFPKVGLEPSVTFIKPLDATHKLVTVEVRNQLYLILLNANQSVVLDKITLDFSLKNKDSGRLKEDLMEETKERLRHSKLKGSYV
ncbi:hypothetical protein [Helicobacter vulpis]|uniref:hypothetical protein n=1 Tax=Helicobacter vulpis TaxID=2316076 RepID=UPI001F1B82A1|nr:hypothetical protein [Helicobacter vulpis]